jgi:hypothetical protein
MNQKHSAPLTDSVLSAISRLVDDAQTTTREPSHSDLDFLINRAGVLTGDPKNQGQAVGKAKRIRSTLSWSLEHNPDGGARLIADLITHLRAVGGFRIGSPNYVGDQPIVNAIQVFRTEGFELSLDGELRSLLLDTLSGTELTAALNAYVRRAKRGAADAVLVSGTGKDLLEATAAHVMVSRYGTYSEQSNFPTLLGQAYVTLGLATPLDQKVHAEPPHRRLERSMFDAACAINQLRNREGTGHGRPWLPSVTGKQAKVAIELMGNICEYILTTMQGD